MEDKTNRIRVNKSEFDVIVEISSLKPDLYKFEKINKHEYIIKFSDLDKACELDELIKDQLVEKGFNIYDNPNSFGLNCESLIDKMYRILE